MCVYCKARRFDSIMFSIIIEEKLVSEKLLSEASLPYAGKHNIGTLGIKANIIRSQALSKVRKQFAKHLKLNADKINKVSYRASNLNKLK
jgi:hypothetical protein